MLGSLAGIAEIAKSDVRPGWTRAIIAARALPAPRRPTVPTTTHGG